MRADNSHFIDAARRRSQAIRRRALAALRRMDNTGLPANVDALAREAGVSRSWLYSQADLRAETTSFESDRTTLNSYVINTVHITNSTSKPRDRFCGSR